MTSEEKWNSLEDILRDMGLAVLAYSGGVDSSLLLKACAEVMGPNLIAVTAVSETYPQAELCDAMEFARSIGAAHRVIRTSELLSEDFARNDADRCYHCKRELFGGLRKIADADGIAFVLDGTNKDDLSDFRPGRRAAEEFSVRSPLVEAGFTKADVRFHAARLRLPMMDKPPLACLASRIPYGTRITRENLSLVQSAEDLLRAYGLRQIRVRHHGDTARIEVDISDFGKLISQDIRQEIVSGMKALGYTFVSLDLEGYRTGSMNEGIRRGLQS